MSNSVKTTVRMDGALVKSVKRYAVEAERTMGEVMEEALAEFLKKKGAAVSRSTPFYAWAERLSRRKGFSRLKEGDIVRLVRECRSA